MCINSAKVIKLPSHCSNNYLNTRNREKNEKAHLFLAIEEDDNAGVAALSRLLSVFGDAEAGWNDGVARLLNVNNPRFGDQLGFCRGENSSDENRFLAGTKSRLMLLLFSSSFFLLIALFLGFFFVQFPVLSSVFLGKFWVSLSFLSGFFLGFFL